jgi:hypothetical protein
MERGNQPTNQSNQPYPETRTPIRYPMNQGQAHEDVEMHRVPEPPQEERHVPRSASFSDEDCSYVDREIPEGTFCGQFFASVKKNIVPSSARP